jgi:hypothetical protein
LSVEWTFATHKKNNACSSFGTFTLPSGALQDAPIKDWVKLAVHRQRWLGGGAEKKHGMD